MGNFTWLYAGAVYALAVWLARRAAIDIPVRIAIFFYAIVFIFLREALTTDVVNLPADYLATLLPWREITGYHRPLNTEINDIVLQIVPWAHQVRESWKALDVPLWNHLAGSGYPLLGNAQSSAFSPLRILGLPLSLGHSFAFEAAMKLLGAMTFTWLFCRRRGYSDIASAAAAVAFAFSSFLVVWLHFPLATVAAFLPAAMYHVDLLAERVTFGRFAFGAFLWAALIFSGHPETVAHIFFLCLLYALWIMFVQRKAAKRFVFASAAVLLFAALLAAPFLTTFGEALTKSKRYQQLKENPQTIELVTDWPTMALLVQPHFFGRLGSEKPWQPVTPEYLTGFAGILGIAAFFALVLFERRARSFEAFLVFATMIILAIILGWPGISDVFHFAMRLAANERLRLLLCFLLAVQIAAAWERREILSGALVAAGLLLFIFLRADFPHAWHRQNAVLEMLPSILVLLWTAVACHRFQERRQAAAVQSVLLLFIVVELWNIGRYWNPNVGEEWMYPRTPLISALEDLKSKEKTPFRIVAAGPSFFSNTPAVFGFEDIRAHDPMANARYVDRLRDLSGYSSDRYFAQWRNFETGFLDFLNVKYVVTPPQADLEDPGRYALVYDGRDGRIFENRHVIPRFFTARNVVLEFNDERFEKKIQEQRDWRWTALLETLPVENEKMPRDMLSPRPKNSPEASLKLTEARPTSYRMLVNAPRYTLVVSSIPWWAGWKVEGEGVVAPIRVNGAFLAFTVRPGVTDARVVYEPWSFRAGVWAAAFALLALILGWVIARSVERRRLGGAS